MQSAYEAWTMDGAWGGDFDEHDDKDWIISDFKWEP